MNKRLAILANWSAASALEAHVRIHLEKLRPHCDVLALASNSPLTECARADAETLCDAVIERDNIGFDFGAWRETLIRFDADEFDEILLTNSSIIGPLFSVADAFDEMRGRSCDFWGLTFSREYALHIQSFFMVFRKPVIQSETWRTYWRDLETQNDKERVIQEQEIRLYECFSEAGFKGDCLIPLDAGGAIPRFFVRRAGVPVPLWLPADRRGRNWTITAPLQLIEMGFPYLKASLVWGAAQHNGAPLEKIKSLPQVDYPWREVGL
jgi:rhamnosyltransferase